MKTVAETITVTGEGLTVDLIIWRKFRKPTPGLLEAVLDANRGLSATELLPLGKTFTIPAYNSDDPITDLEVITLWS